MASKIDGNSRKEIIRPYAKPAETGGRVAELALNAFSYLLPSGPATSVRNRADQRHRTRNTTRLTAAAVAADLTAISVLGDKKYAPDVNAALSALTPGDTSDGRTQATDALMALPGFDATREAAWTSPDDGLRQAFRQHTLSIAVGAGSGDVQNLMRIDLYLAPPHHADINHVSEASGTTVTEDAFAAGDLEMANHLRQHIDFELSTLSEPSTREFVLSRIFDDLAKDQQTFGMRQLLEDHGYPKLGDEVSKAPEVSVIEHYGSSARQAALPESPRFVRYALANAFKPGAEDDRAFDAMLDAGVRADTPFPTSHGENDTAFAYLDRAFSRLEIIRNAELARFSKPADDQSIWVSAVDQEIRNLQFLALSLAQKTTFPSGDASDRMKVQADRGAVEHPKAPASYISSSGLHP